ncbi:MAG: isoleucine--tRNA ligase, partial [Candidatus Sumerlaeia bacterium]|nr:isoleucine--tRNA ligase [Candidatus Sumerlaeia bacterium]
ADPTTDYSKTVNLPKTDFPQRGNLPVREPERLEHWREINLDDTLKNRTDRPDYVLHDGPPYANGDIHIGHALNKVLKDFIVRYKAMAGFRTHYVPGWDCHGLPIEQKVVDELRKKKEYADKTPLEIRKLCADYARKWVDVQREQFIRLGIGGDWQNPYITMDPKFEVAVLDGLRVLVEKGLVYKGLKVVYWDPVFETALAEAEIEYNDAHVSPSIYVRFPLRFTPERETLRQKKKVSIVIWTTTPWTLPANLGVSLHPDFEYVAYEVNDEVLIVAKGLLESFVADTGLEGGKVVDTFAATEFDRMACAHPLLDKDSLIMMGSHVTLEQGTGCVHTAPGHGVDDFQIGQVYGLPVFNPVDERGCFTSAYPDMEGVKVFDANPRIVELLKEKGLLVGHKSFTHSYPYSWRSRKPIIMRATEQWFMNVDQDGLRDLALAQCDKVEWTPKWGYDRIYNMLKGRPDWCLSRQRAWGVPIPSIYDKESEISILDPEVLEKVNSYVATEGTDCWFSRPLTDFLPEKYAANPDRYEKEFNCLDVWFDSGCTHLAVLNEESDLSWPADLYLEGSDQHRGWFQSSMWVSLGVKGKAPYKQVLTHGFVLDEFKRKMSKSLGNVISPLDIMEKNGADLLRMWVASEDYRNDVSISETALGNILATYRRIRNTLRFILGNIDDFDPATDRIAVGEMSEDDRWCLHQLAGLTEKATQAYDRFEFHRVYQLVSGFCFTELGSLYLDIIKDRLYCSAPEDKVRRASQTVLYELVSVLSRISAPIIPFTSDEAWTEIPGVAEPSVHLADFPKAPAEWVDEELNTRWERLLALRSEVNLQIEKLRPSEKDNRPKIIGNSLEAKVTLQTVDVETMAFLESGKGLFEDLFIVSEVLIEETQPREIPERLVASGLHLSVKAEKTGGTRCPRCRKYYQQIGTDPSHPQLCGRCADAVQRMNIP